MPVVDNSGVPNVGLALLRANLSRFKGGQPRWETRGLKHYLVIVGPTGETFESCSFAPGSPAAKVAQELIA